MCQFPLKSVNLITFFQLKTNQLFSFSFIPDLIEVSKQIVDQLRSQLVPKTLSERVSKHVSIVWYPSVSELLHVVIRLAQLLLINQDQICAL